jgi:hypothetical protein
MQLHKNELHKLYASARIRLTYYGKQIYVDEVYEACSMHSRHEIRIRKINTNIASFLFQGAQPIL